MISGREGGVWPAGQVRESYRAELPVLRSTHFTEERSMWSASMPLDGARAALEMLRGQRV